MFNLNNLEKPKNVKKLEPKGEVYEMEVEDWVSEEDYFLYAASSTSPDGFETRPVQSAARNLRRRKIKTLFLRNGLVKSIHLNPN